jgi:hypothetical protein
MNRFAALAGLAMLACGSVGGVAATAAPTTTTTVVAPTTTAVAPTTTAVAPTTTAGATTTVAAVTTTVAAVTTTVAAATTSVAPSTTVAATTTTVIPAAITAAEIRAAKVGWSRFVADNFATPNAILDPCPLMTVDSANAGVAAIGLVPTDLPYGVSLYRDLVGTGIIGITCGADLSEAATPAGATMFAVEVTILDGQAVFPQYVERVAGRNTPIERAAPELGGEMFARCRNDPQFCVAGWHSDGLIVTVKLDGPRTPDSEAHVRRLLVAVAPQVVANLASVAPST